RLDVRRIATIKQGDEAIGSRVRVKVVKNKTAAPFREAEFDVVFGKGVSYAGDILDLAVAKGVVEKSGAWYSYGEERLGQGRENAKEHLETHTAVRREIEAAVLKLYGLGSKAAAHSDAPPEPPEIAKSPV